MLTADDARKMTAESVAIQLKEYITNCVDPAIKKAASQGQFSTVVGLKDVTNAKIIANEVVKALNLAGFDTKHVYNCDQRDYENHISINWEGSK